MSAGKGPMFAPFISAAAAGLEKGDKNPAPPFTRVSEVFFFFHRAAHIYYTRVLLTWLVVRPLDSVPIVGCIQLVGDQFEGKNLLVDLHVGSRDVNFYLWIALLGCQTVANNLRKAIFEVFEGDC